MPAGCSGPVSVVDLPGSGPMPGYTPSEPSGNVNPKCARDCDPSAATENAGRRYVRATLTSINALALSRRAARIARLFASAASIACFSVSVSPLTSPGAQMRATPSSRLTTSQVPVRIQHNLLFDPLVVYLFHRVRP